MNITFLNSFGTLIARSLMGVIFLLAGLHKVSGYAGTQAYMESMGVAGALLPLVILLEVGGGLALIVGLGARFNAAALALFTLVAGFLFHGDFADQMQSILFMKNMVIVGGLMLLAIHGPGAWSLERLLPSRFVPNGQA